MDIQFLQQNWMLVAVAGVSGAMLVWSFIGGKLSGIEEAATLKAPRLFNDDALILDVREDKEFATGHIPGPSTFRSASCPAVSRNSRNSRPNPSSSPAVAASARRAPATC